jgi:hypothetical protein
MGADYKKEISFTSQVAITKEDGNTVEWVEQTIEKKATFSELSKTNRKQHKLHFKILGLMDSFGVVDENDSNKIRINSDALYDLTVKCIEVLLEPNDEFTESDKNEFLNDSEAILKFGLWMLNEKLMPFFSKFKIS